MPNTVSTAERQSRVAVVILNWNNWADTLQCLESLISSEYHSFDVIIVDNGSTDLSIREISRYLNERGYQGGMSSELSRAFCQEDSSKTILYVGTGHGCPSVTIHTLSKNLGFAEGNNIGMTVARLQFDAEYVLLLNNDTIPRRDMVSRLADVLDNDITVGCVQAKLLRMDNPSTIDTLGQQISSDSSVREIGADEKDGIDASDIIEVFGACAAATMYRHKMLDCLGGFDKRYFSLLEDVDLSWRIRLSGYRIVTVTSAVALHRRGISKGGRAANRVESPLLRFHRYANALYLSCKFLPVRSFITYNLTFICLLCMSLITSLRIGQASDFARTLASIVFHERRHIARNYRLKGLYEIWITSVSPKEYYGRILRRNDSLSK